MKDLSPADLSSVTAGVGHDFIQCWPDESSAAWLLSQTENVKRIRAQRAAESEADYQQYRFSRSMNVRPETLAAFFGDTLAAAMEARYRAEAAQ
jgi:hypothetical protein